jgi:hypothetical protein
MTLLMWSLLDTPNTQKRSTNKDFSTLGKAAAQLSLLATIRLMKSLMLGIIQSSGIFISPSDGDNFDNDMPEMENVLVQKLLPVTQYFAYINVRSTNLYFLQDYDSAVLQLMRTLQRSHPNLQYQIVTSYADIFPVFRHLFKKNKGE